ncbi:uncharacterized protein EKO05_0003393 [Ascochyta rabiei]|uniref:uncharacterized protein n=1 Tax=Didymella rabiei TaxID=5454 RepID=UPI002205283C|nr:uncharacterized protein EKO05_0003393 [Ascochyta rabiei]UPX12858.1 hypothetical protein EKO05_0003393 [Ascochyta rabiei]
MACAGKGWEGWRAETGFDEVRIGRCGSWNHCSSGDMSVVCMSSAFMVISGTEEGGGERVMYKQNDNKLRVSITADSALQEAPSTPPGLLADSQDTACECRSPSGLWSFAHFLLAASRRGGMQTWFSCRVVDGCVL